jgi:predicted nucleotidyltransferase
MENQIMNRPPRQMVTLDPILQELRSRLEGIYGERLARVVLFGSRARGEEHPDSDYDVAVFLREMKDRWEEIRRMNPIITDLMFDRGALVQALPYDEKSFEQRTSLMRDIREEGIEL